MRKDVWITFSVITRRYSDCLPALGGWQSRDDLSNLHSQRQKIKLTIRITKLGLQIDVKKGCFSMKKSKKKLSLKRLDTARKLLRIHLPHPFNHLSLWRANPNQKFEFKHGRVVEVFP
jgi:hypothetical protein